MIYEVTHITSYAYDAPVVVNDCILRLRPRDGAGQRLGRFALEAEPAPQDTSERVDPFGNLVTRWRYLTPHDELTITSRFRISVERPPPPIPALTPVWEHVVSGAASVTATGAESPVFALYPSRMVAPFAAATNYARESFAPGRPIYEAALELSDRINRDFVYDPKATDVRTKPADAFAARRGVCQDFAHVMISGLRGLGLPALYVSGYIRTYPPPGQERLVGADASHAWVAVWCGPTFGWLGLDPTNAIPEGDSHIVLARGRDYADVPPVDGLVLSSGKHELDFSVDVAPVSGVL